MPDIGTSKNADAFRRREVHRLSRNDRRRHRRLPLGLSRRQIMELNDNDLSRIREAAYFKWLDAGAPSTDGVGYWLDAEFEYLHDGDRAREQRATQPGSRKRSSTSSAGQGSDQFGFENEQRADKETLIGTRG
jgi:hypothetical protein